MSMRVCVRALFFIGGLTLGSLLVAGTVGALLLSQIKGGFFDA